MSIQSIRNRISNIQREIQTLQNRLTEKTKNEASKSNRIIQIKKSVTKYTSLSSLQSKDREIERLENDTAKIQKDKADLTKRISDKTAQLYKYQQELYKEQNREQKKFQESIIRMEREERQKQRELLAGIKSVPFGNRYKTSYDNVNQQHPDYDAFISHASEDKDDLVRPLAEELIKNGLSIWYDEFKLKVGDSLRRSIDAGLVRSKFGIVILSPSFFAKNWPQYELDGLVEKEMAGNKVILPLWHKVSKNEVMKYSPALADKVALNTAMYTIEELAKELANAIKNA